MFFIVSNLLILFFVLSVILYRVVSGSVFHYKYGRLLKERISQSLRQTFIDIRNDFVAHMMSLCEPDEEELFEPYTDSPLRTCPPCEFLESPPKEGVEPEENNNASTIPIPIARRGRGRGARGRGVAQQRGQVQRVQPIRAPIVLPLLRLAPPDLVVRELEPLSPPAVLPDGNMRIGDRLVLLVNDRELLRQEVDERVDNIEVQLFRRNEP